MKETGVTLHTETQQHHSGTAAAFPLIIMHASFSSLSWRCFDFFVIIIAVKRKNKSISISKNGKRNSPSVAQNMRCFTGHADIQLHVRSEAVWRAGSI